MKKHVVIIGGGASGMAAAYAASGMHRVTLLEQNEKLGKKLYITGKGRCNVTNASDIPAIMNNVVTSPKFLYSALYTFTNDDLAELLKANGCPLKTERGNRVFPESDHSSDVIRAWERILKSRGVEICLKTRVKELVISENTVRGVKLSGGGILAADAVILCTGGLSYPVTGSRGDGHRMAKESGHSLTECFPALVGLNTEEKWPENCAGLSLKNIRIRIERKGRTLYEDFGEMLFTHTGVSGPVILSASSYVSKFLNRGEILPLTVDLKPALSEEELDARILRDFSEEMNRQFRNSLSRLLPSGLIPVVLSLCAVDPVKTVNRITREERKTLIRVIKGLTLHLNGSGSFDEAIITQGGVSVKEIDPSTMESRICRNLYLAGELLDIDALTGGFNLQLAWSTGYLAGNSIGGEDGI